MHNEAKKNIKISKKSLLISIFSILAVFVVGTFAWFTWRSNETALVLTVGDINNLNITLAPYKFNSSIVPSSSYNTNDYVQVKASNNSEELSYSVGLFYRINSIAPELVSSDFQYTIERSTDGSTYTSYKTGDFSTAQSGVDYPILTAEELSADTTYHYRVYIWIESNGDQSSMQGKIFDAELRAEYSKENEGGGTNTSSGPSAPVLDETGMVPVTIANDGTVTTVSKTDPNWYNYEEKQWANAVLVKQTGTKTRTYYLTTPNETVNQDDILAYYVWIPKYKYKIWIKDGTTSSSPQEIDIVFEDEDTVTTGSEVGEYMTHPAFNFGGEKLPGIWVGKFETSASPDSNCFKSPSNNNCRNNNIEPRILPKVNALNYQYIGNQFMTALKFSGGSMDSSSGIVTFGGSTTFGLSDTTNSHMMKNSEWGAVAYLSHSKYGTCTNGTCTEIRINNYWSSPKSETGCGAAEGVTSKVTTCAIRYGESTSYPQSTTGNISGVFDMSGGLDEYVMGNYNNKANSTYFAKLPESKYYDVYLRSTFNGNYSTNMSKCTLPTCGGHALFETASWYSDYADFVASDEPWFRRGGSYSSGTYAGAFHSYTYNGDSYDGRGFRSVLLPSGA